MPHYFTREEAEALLPKVSVILRSIQKSHTNLRQTEDELNTLHQQAAGNGHHLHAHMFQLQENISNHTRVMRKLLEQLDQYGCELKDPNTGLIDFLSLRNGREIYLCWRLGEDRINFWHDLQSGFAGRQPL